jgi:alpha-tubulin suppressor-like RCC1 family protein
MILVVAGALTGALSCNDDGRAPTAPESTPVIASASQPLEFFQVTAGDLHSCGVTVDNRLFCWGVNNHGQLGDGTVTDRLRPTPIAPNLSFRQVSAGDLYTCAVTTTFHAYCWGQNFGHLGDGTLTERHTPVRVKGSQLFRQVAAGSDHTCGVTLADRAFCWGDNSFGDLGDGSGTFKLAPALVKGGLAFRQVDPGGLHTCGVTTDRRAYCWGWNKYGQSGDSSIATFHPTPVPVAGTRHFRQISAGGNATCAVTASDLAFCWGQGQDGQLGSGTQRNARVPRRVVGGISFTRVTVGRVHTCGEATGKKAYCWGVNANGQLGDGSTVIRQLSPVPVAGGLLFAQLSAGTAHTCGKTPDSLAYCWGFNAGALGDGTTNSTNVPVAVVGPR